MLMSQAAASAAEIGCPKWGHPLRRPHPLFL
jgi:hypothetical protein